MCRATLVLPVQANSTRVGPQRFAELAELPIEAQEDHWVYQEWILDTMQGTTYPGNPAAELRLRSRS